MGTEVRLEGGRNGEGERRWYEIEDDADLWGCDIRRVRLLTGMEERSGGGGGG